MVRRSAMNKWFKVFVGSIMGIMFLFIGGVFVYQMVFVDKEVSTKDCPGYLCQCTDCSEEYSARGWWIHSTPEETEKERIRAPNLYTSILPPKKPKDMKYCFHIGSRSLSACQEMVKRNMNYLVNYQLGFTLDDYNFRCTLADNDNLKGCEDEDNTIKCFRIPGPVLYKDLPKKQFLSVSSADDSCYYVFNADDDLKLLRPFWQLMERIESKCDRHCHVGKTWWSSRMREGVNSDEYWLKTFRTKEYPPFMSGPFLGFSGDLVPLFKFLGENGLYHMEGNADVYFGLLMTAIKANYVDWGPGWFTHLSDHHKKTKNKEKSKKNQKSR